MLRTPSRHLAASALCALLGPSLHAQFQDPYAGYTGTNLILDGSGFETGRDGFSFHRKMYLDEHAGGYAFEPAVVDVTPGAAWEGRACLRIDNPRADQAILDFPWMPLVPDTLYDLSFSARAVALPGEPGPIVLTAVVWGPGFAQVATRAFPLTTSWTRYSLANAGAPIAISPGEFEENLVHVQFYLGPWKSALPANDWLRNRGTAWIDGVCVAPTSAGTAYLPPTREPIEVGVALEDASGARPLHLFHGDGGEIAARVRLHATEAVAGPVRVRLQLFDTFENELGQRLSRPFTLVNGLAEAVITIRNVPAAPTNPAASPRGVLSPNPAVQLALDPESLDLTAGRLGLFHGTVTVELAAGGPSLGDEQLIFAVIEPLAQRRPGEPVFGVSLPLLRENFQNWYPFPGETLANVGILREDVDVLLDAVAGVGFQWMRCFDFALWAAIEPQDPAVSPGEYNDWFLDRLEARGLALMPILGVVLPWWAASPDFGQPIVPWMPQILVPDATAWGDHVARLVARYEGRIRDWELVNEAFFFYSPQQYRQRILQPARMAVDQQVPGAGVRFIGPAGGIEWKYGAEDWDGQGNFIDQIFDQQAGVELDVLTQHTYLLNAPPFEDGVVPSYDYEGRIDSYVDDYVGSNAPGSNTVEALWDSESNVQMPTLYRDQRIRDLDYDNPPDFTPSFLAQLSGDPQRSRIAASYWPRQVMFKLAHGVQRVNLHTFVGTLSQTQGGGGLMEYDGSPNHLLVAIHGMIRQLWDVDLSLTHETLGTAPSGAQCRAVTFGRLTRGPVAGLWRWKEPEAPLNVAIAVNPAGVAVYDMAGNALSIAVDSQQRVVLTLTASPLYLEGISVDYATLFAAVDSALAPGIGGE